MRDRCVVSCLGFASALAVAVGLGGCSDMPPEISARSETITSAAAGEPARRGPHLVGSRTIFVRDPARPFDPWNAIYGSADYQALLTHLAEIGEPRTLVTEVWYPVEGRSLPDDARRATYLDYALGDRTIFDRRGVSPYLVTASGETVAQLADRDPGAHADLVTSVLDELAARPRGSFLDAEVAPGRFPLIVLSHGGFTGNVRPDSHREIFTSHAETLASHGYVVAAMSHTGDSRQPTVFHDAGSALRQEGPAAVAAAYEILFSQAAVPDRIIGLIFQPGGWPLANTMMQRLFQMRVDDVMSVIQALRAADGDSGSFLDGRLDLQHIGVAGFSLGSMTTQIALASRPELTTGMSWNNGLPSSWQPPGFQGLSKPHFFSLATEDELSRTFFTNVPFLVYPQVVPGGQPSDFLFLEAERVFPPTRLNPEPVVRAAYERAAGPKLLLGLVDSTHWDVTDYDDYLFPRHRLAAGEIQVAFDNRLRHLPFGDEVLDPTFVGGEYETMSWQQLLPGRWLYRPHLIRDYYGLAWYGTFLKRQPLLRHLLRRDPFPDTTVRQHGL